MRVTRAWAAAVCACFAIGLAAGAQTFEVELMSGDNIPGGGSFDSFSPLLGLGPNINESGAFAFEAVFDGGNKSGVFVGTLDGDLRRVMSIGDTEPHGQKQKLVGAAAGPILDDSGRATFLAVLADQIDDPSTAQTEVVIYSESSPGGNLWQVAREGSSTPGPGDFESVFSDYDVSSGGRVLFGGEVSIPDVTQPPRGLYTYDIDFENLYAHVVLPGDAPSSTDPPFTFVTASQINDNGQHVLFIGAANDGTTNVSGVYQTGGADEFTPVFRNNMLTSSGNTITGGGFAQQNNSGLVSAIVTVTDSTTSLSRETALRITPGNAPIELFSQGDTLPGTSQTIDEIDFLTLNTNNQFVAMVQTTSNDTAIVLFDEVNGLTTIARTGQVTPGGSTLKALELYEFNDAGQAIFTSSDLGDFEGLFAFDPNEGLIEILTAGTLIDGSALIITKLRYLFPGREW